MKTKTLVISGILLLAVSGVVYSFWGGFSRQETVTISESQILAEVKAEADCPCGCGFTLEDCQKYDPNCPIRPGAVAKAEDLISSGKSKEEVLAALGGKTDEEISVDDDPSLGPADAEVTIVEFSDFQCPFCKKAEPTIKKVLEEYPEEVRFVYRDFPLSFHQHAQKAAEASECADEQGKFWSYHDKLFENQSEWNSLGEEKFKEYAAELNLDTEEFSICLDQGEMASEVQKDFEDGRAYGVEGTPAFFINGKVLSGALPFEVFKKEIDLILGN